MAGVVGIGNAKGIGNASGLGSVGSGRTIVGENFYVGGGVMVFKNFFISLDNIVAVERIKEADIQTGSLVVGLVLGIIVILIPSDIVRAIGVLWTCFMGVALWLAIQKNKKKVYTMSIRLSNGERYNFQHSSAEFIDEIMLAIRNCIDDRKGVYNIMSNTGTIKYYEDKSIGKVSNNTFSGNVGDITAGDKVTNETNAFDGSTIKNATNNVRHGDVLTGEEWKMLEMFLAKRENAFQNGNAYHAACAELYEHTQKKDARGLKECLERIGRNAITTIFGAGIKEATKAVIVPILQKILGA